MSRVLGVVGSPRKNGNTHVLVDAALEGARDAGGATEIVLLGDLAMGECDGCHVCWTGKPCVRDDDMNDVYPKIASADAIVFGTPVYWYAATALMKAFVDRLVYFNCDEHRPKVRGMAAGLVVPFEEQSPDMAGAVVTMFEKSCRYLEMELVGTVIAPGVTGRGEVRDRPDRLREAYELGGVLAASGERRVLDPE